MNSKKVKHNKIRNTGLLFEFLLRQTTVDVLSKTKKSNALISLKKDLMKILNWEKSARYITF